MRDIYSDKNLFHKYLFISNLKQTSETVKDSAGGNQISRIAINTDDAVFLLLTIE